MVMRGVEKAEASTRTSTFLGTFQNNADLRKEFFTAITSPSH
jgi:GTP cyclohydrolase I